eukprot:s260_g7.t1
MVVRVTARCFAQSLCELLPVFILAFEHHVGTDPEDADEDAHDRTVICEGLPAFFPCFSSRRSACRRTCGGELEWKCLLAQRSAKNRSQLQLRHPVTGSTALALRRFATEANAELGPESAGHPRRLQGCGSRRR